MNKIIARPQLTFTEALKQGWGRLLDWKGRSRRSEYWWCALALAVSSWVLGLVPFLGSILQAFLYVLMIPLAFRRLHDTGRSGWWYVASLVASFAFVGSMIGPMMKAMNGNPDKMSEKLVEAFTNPLTMVLWLLTIVLGIVLLVFFCQDSKAETNKWGDSPKYVSDDDEFGKDTL